MFIELTALDGRKVLINTYNVTAISKSYNGPTGVRNKCAEIWSVGDTGDSGGMIVQELYEEVRYLIHSLVLKAPRCRK